MKSEEAQLIEACIRRDERACRQLYERFAPKMYGICLRYTHTTAAAEDVLHDGFIKVFENLGKLRATDALGSWICKIMVYTAINSQRNELPLASCDVVDEVKNRDYASSDEIYAKIDAEIVVNAMRDLPASFRMVLNLCEVEGYSIEEVSKMLKVKNSTVRSALTRAKRMLAEKLKSEML